MTNEGKKRAFLNEKYKLYNKSITLDSSRQKTFAENNNPRT